MSDQDQTINPPRAPLEGREHFTAIYEPPIDGGRENLPVIEAPRAPATQDELMSAYRPRRTAEPGAPLPVVQANRDAWQDDPVVKAAPAPWEAGKVIAWNVNGRYQMADPHAPGEQQRRVAAGLGDAFEAGWQNSATGLVARGKLPDIVLDPQHANWAINLMAIAGQTLPDLPLMAVGGYGGAAAGAAAGSAVPVVGTVAGGVVGGGAGAFALPTAIRESFIQALEKGEVKDADDFLARVGTVLKHTSKDALIGGLTSGAGAAAATVVGPALGEAVMAGKVKPRTARVGTSAADAAGQIVTLPTAAAVMSPAPPK